MTSQKKTSPKSWYFLVIFVLVLLYSLLSPWERPPEPPPRPPVETVDKEICYAGCPKNVRHACQQIDLLKNDGFLVGYCEEKKNPAWVAYKVFDIADTASLKRPGRFKVDKRTRAQVKHGHYTRTGYDRGHMAPNHAIATRYGREAQIQTFLMTNICPQKPNLNRRVWRALEEEVADEYAQREQEIWVTTGPVFGAAEEILPSGVAVPEAFYKILVDEMDGDVRTRAYIIPQSVEGDENPEQFLTTVDEVEKQTGLDFLWQFSDGHEAEIEQAAKIQPW